MSKLFVFGIGGTGSRVLKSLTMLLMAGVRTKVDEIIPIVIDKDETNGDLVRTKRIIENYMNARKAFAHDRDKFFSTEVSLLDNKLCLPLIDRKKKFSDYIMLDQLDTPNRAIVEALFSKKALDMDTTEGFRGIPSIGSVVLNQFEDSENFKSFAQQFTPGDKIFIISSIFGGTGASGFPLLVKTLRGNTDLPSWNSIQDAPIGAISVLPYFVVGEADEEGKVNVDSDTFTDKAKAALAYYAETMEGQVDSMYYAGDKKVSTYSYSAGGSEQENRAHLIELVSALAIVDFANKEMHERTGETTYHEFGILSPQLNIDRILFADLHTDTRKLICNPLIQFYAFNQYMKLVFDAENVHQPWSHNYPWNKTNDFDKVFRQSNSMSTLNDCLNSFSNWLMELNDKEVHRHRFSPFNLTNQSIAFVLGNSNDIVIKRGKFLYRDWAWFDNELNRQSTKRDTQISESLSKEQRFLELFYRTTKKFVDDLIPNSQDN